MATKKAQQPPPPSGASMHYPNTIVTFFHCGKCMEELPVGKSPREWANNEIGFTKAGFQVWCKRHECNVAAFDFRGHQISFAEAE